MRNINTFSSSSIFTRTPLCHITSGVSIVRKTIGLDGHAGITTLVKGSFASTIEARKSALPTLQLLNDYGQTTTKVDQEELEANKERIVDTLRNYKIEIAKIKAAGGYLDLVQWRAHRSHAVGMADDGYVLEYRYGDAGKDPFSGNADKETQDQQALYGIIDKTFSGATVPAAVGDLVDVSSAQVFTTNTVTGVTLATGSDADANGSISTQELRAAVVAAGGWYGCV